MLLTSNWSDIIDPAMRQIFNDAYKNFPEQYSTLFNVMDSDRHTEKWSSATGFGMAVDVAEGEEIPDDACVQGYDVSFTHGKVGKSFRVSKELLEDDLFGIIAQKPADLAKSIRRRIEYDAADVFNNATSTSRLGGDGKSLGNDAHPREDGKENCRHKSLLNQGKSYDIIS